MTGSAGPGSSGGAPGSLGRRFAELVERPDEEVPLDEAALLIAAHGDPAADIAAGLARLDELASSCPEATLDGLCRHLFDDLGFAGNSDDYGDPRNSYLHEVLARRVGIPITLSVVLMETGRRLGVPLAGVGMPGHFLVRHLGDPDVFVDAFGGGARLDEAGCEAIFRRLGGTGPWLPAYVAPVGARSILTRMLANLQNVFLPRSPSSAAWVLELRLAFPDVPAATRRDIARLLGSFGRFRVAAAELERLAASRPDTERAELAAEALALRARTN